MASLLGFYISGNTRQHNAFLIGMIFALLGDIFLLFEGELFFKIGLFSFLLMQISYASVFLGYKGTVNKYFWIVSVFLIFFSMFLLSLLWPGLEGHRVAVCIYILAILFMVLSAFRMNIKNPIHGVIAWGALSFLISDSILALDKFYKPIFAANYLIMIPYIIAQYCIVVGMKSVHSKVGLPQ
jgi:uncharacterized membrane protein YhhN